MPFFQFSSILLSSHLLLFYTFLSDDFLQEIKLLYQSRLTERVHGTYYTFLVLICIEYKTISIVEICFMFNMNCCGFHLLFVFSCLESKSISFSLIFTSKFTNEFNAFLPCMKKSLRSTFVVYVLMKIKHTFFTRIHL